MPLADWCTKLAHCADAEAQVIARIRRPHGHDRGRDAVPVRATALSVGPTAPAATATANDTVADVEDDEEDDEEDEQLLNSGSTIATRSSNTNSNGDDDEQPDSARSLSELTTSRRLSALVKRRPRVPTISATSLYNKLQTAGVVVIDCRDADEFALRHLPTALSCPYAKGRKKSVDDVIALAQNAALTRKLAARDLMEVVVIGANRASASVLYKMDYGYRVARLLQTEGRVFSVRFLAQGFPLFARKYAFMLTTRPTMCVGLPTPPAPPGKTPAIQSYPNEVVDGFLYLGNYWHATSLHVLDALEITHVLNVGAPTTDRVPLTGVTYLDLDIPDRVDADMTAEFAPAVAFIESALRSSRTARVLVHCIQGVSRSATVAIWYVMVATRCTLSAAYAHVLKCRPLVFPNQGFMAQLVASEEALYGSASVTLDELELLQHGLLQATDRASSQLRESFSA